LTEKKYGCQHEYASCLKKHYMGTNEVRKL